MEVGHDLHILATLPLGKVPQYCVDMRRARSIIDLDARREKYLASAGNKCL
jgi:hypothetical protein